MLLGAHEKDLIKAGLALGIVAATTYFAYKRLKEDKEDKVRFPVKYDHPPLSSAIRTIAKLPKFLRRSLALKGSLPKPPRDAIDVLGESPETPSPFEIVEIEKDKIWRVRYHFLVDPTITDSLGAITGKSFDDADAILANVPSELKDLVLEDIEDYRKRKGMTEKELVKKGCLTTQDMLVARLNTNDEETGKQKVLIYNPCRMRPLITTWLKDIGSVSYIVSGSSSHTNQVCQAAEAFPEAKIVCAKPAEQKCAVAGLKEAHFVYTEEESLGLLNKELAGSGAELQFVKGDAFTHTALVLVHEYLFECDLTYGRHCKTRYSGMSKEQFEDRKSPRSIDTRMFYYTLMCGTASYNGCCPNYRIMGMDPSSPFVKLMLDEPTDDSCSEMAMSLRKILTLKFKAALSVHGGRDDPSGIPAEDFKRDIDANWNWLDGGKSLRRI